MRDRRLTPNEASWWLTLGVGAAVLVVVWALLEVLRRTVNDVDQAVADVWTMGKRLAQNTQTSHLLQGTKARAAELLEELENHQRLAERSEG